MTDEDRHEAERLAAEYADNDNHPASPYNFCARKAFCTGYAAACESKRPRSAILVDALRHLARFGSEAEKYVVNQALKNAGVAE